MEKKNIKTSDGEKLTILTKSDTLSSLSIEKVPGLNIEQLNIGQEVKSKIEIRGEFNTNDASLTRVNNIFNLYIDDPENEIFSFNIDGTDYLFQIDDFGGNPTLAYSTFETDLQDALGEMYTVEYTGSGNYTIVKEFEKTITFTEKNLVTNIALDSWTSQMKIDIIIDGVTSTIDATTYPIPSDALNYVVTQLPVDTYYTKVSGSNLVIARIDQVTPVITSTPYNRYSYSILGFDSIISPTSSELGGSDGSNDAKVYRHRITLDGTLYTYTLASGITWSSVNNAYTWAPVFSASGSIRNTDSRGSALLDTIYIALTTGYTKSGETYTSISGNDRNVINFSYFRDDYVQSTISGFETDYVKDSGLGLVTTSAYNGVNLTETNHIATITVSTYSEITTTFTTSSNNYLIRVDMLPVSVEIGAYSSVGNSVGRYEKGEQTVTLGDGSATIDGKVFQTNASNYGTIIKLVKGGFIINFDTTVNNIINYICK